MRVAGPPEIVVDVHPVTRVRVADHFLGGSKNVRRAKDEDERVKDYGERPRAERREMRSKPNAMRSAHDLSPDIFSEELQAAQTSGSGPILLPWDRASPAWLRRAR